MDVRGGKLAINGVIADFSSETLCTEAGHSVALRPQAFAVLRYLAERAGRLVTKGELIHTLWPGLVVTDDSLVQCVHEIRQAFQDRDRAVLKTAPKRGYRLVLPAAAALAAGERPWIEPEQAEAAGAVSSSAFTVTDGADVAERGKIAIAVLPFVNMSSDPEREYFSDGVTEDVITDLSRWHSIAVASRNSTSRFKGQRVDVRAAGRELGVQFLVEGSVRRLGERIRITAQLIDTRTGDHVWAERYDRPMSDLFTLQDEVVRTIVGTLIGRVYVRAADHLRRSSRFSPAAYELTLRGNSLPWNDPSTWAEAKRCFEQAIELDPGYGLPYSLLAIMLLFYWHRELATSPEILDRALILAKQGVEIAEHESTSHTALGLICMGQRSFDEALNHVQRAVDINPANPSTRADLGILLTRIGRAKEGLEQLRDAQRMDPYFAPSWYWPEVGVTRFVLRRYREALANFDRGIIKGAHKSGIMAGCCAKLGLVERSRAMVAQCLAIQPKATVDNLVASTLLKEVGDREHLADCLRLAGMPE